MTRLNFLTLTGQGLRGISLAFALLVLSACASADSNRGHKLAKLFAGKQMVLIIERGESEASATFPSKGAIVQQYLSSTTYQSQAYGEAEAFSSSGYYSLQKRRHQVKETLEVENGEQIKTHYNFESFSSGTFVRSMHDGQTTLRGRFRINQVDEQNIVAPEHHHGITVALSIFDTESELPPEFYPRQGVVLQSYEADGSYEGKGFGPATIDHYGTYEYERIAPNIAVEKTVQIAETFTLPFTMVYVFDTPRSGSWYQDFGDGLIKFSGTFTTFETR